MDGDIKKLHFVGVGGVGMGSLAQALASAGYEVSGSDLALYEPMKSVLQRASVRLIEGFREETCGAVSPDLVVIGNVVRKENPEAAAWIRSGVSFASFPEAVRRFLIQGRRSIVCAGTHGKTTTTSWISYLLSELGLQPSYLIGGVPRDLPQGSLVGNGEVFVGEGDEYDSAFFDKGPKFLHYDPSFVVLSSIEFDHADIYRDLDHVRTSFEKLVSLIPGDGLLVARFEDPVVMGLAPEAVCPVQTFGTSPGAMWSLGAVEESEEGFRFEVLYKRRSAGHFRTPMFGEHNLMNLISGIACAVNLGLPLEKVRPVVERFHGARRRQEVLLREPIVFVDDFAHHPTEVSATLKAVRRRYPKGTLWALFEPRSATARRNVHQDDYVKAFDSADKILVSDPFKNTELDASARFSATRLAEDLSKGGKWAQSHATPAELLEVFLNSYAPGDVVVVMSNGEFDKIQMKIVEAVGSR